MTFLRLGSKGPEVSALQRALKVRNCYFGMIDGDFGPLTQHAVVSFQKLFGLSADGIAGPKTMLALGMSGQVQDPKSVWPKQTECDVFYGNPRGSNGHASPAWEAANLILIKPPFKMTYAGDPIKGIRIHNRCAESLIVVLESIWHEAGCRQEIVDAWGVSIYGGAYNYRLMRGGNSLSMHSWGCAIDLDPARNGFRDPRPHFANVPEVVNAFEAEGWEWGGRWSVKDGMHFQAARVR